MKNGTCPKCAETKAAFEQAALQAAAERQTQAEVDKANSGLIWKCALTFILPLIGGYFLVGPNVKTAPKVFALVWCVLYFGIGASGGAFDDTSIPVIIITSLIFLGPVIYWLINTLFKAKPKS